MSVENDHLAVAKECLAIAESTDAKHEAYRKAAEHIIVHKQREGATNKHVAAAIGKSDWYVKRLLDWFVEKSDDLPFAEPKGAVATRHARSVLKNAPPKEVAKLLSELPDERRQEIVDATDEQAAEKRERAARARERTEKERRERVGLRYVEVEGHLAKARRELLSALNVARVVDWGDEERQLLADTTGKVRALVELVGLSLTDPAQVDWDAELARITED